MQPTPSLRQRLYVIIFRHDTPAGKAFDIGLLLCILGSVAAVMAESVKRIDERYHFELLAIEWAFTIIFSVEYVLRIYCAKRPRRYVFSFFGLIDLLALLPAYLSLLIPHAQALAVVRVMRMMRVFRVLKLSRYLGEANILQQVFKRSIPKVVVFIGTVLSLVVILGTLMHLIEGDENHLESIPAGMYWAIVTLTTVGYGDVVPETDIGRTLAAILMILGYGVIAVPTSIVTAEMVSEHSTRDAMRQRIVCPGCGAAGHDPDAAFCSHCGTELDSPDQVDYAEDSAPLDLKGDLQHFLKAQAPCYPQVLRELAEGHKRTHWMWFIFPQLEGLGSSEMAQRYGIKDLDHARRYLRHPVLGPRARECAQLVADLEDKTAAAVFGELDALKLRSSMTLMQAADPDDLVFRAVLEKMFAGETDTLTLKLAHSRELAGR